MKMRKSLSNLMAIACCAMVSVTCSNDVEIGTSSLQEYQKIAYSTSFAEAIATPASNQNWGFGSFTLTPATEPVSSFEYFEKLNAASRTRAVAETVTAANVAKYSKQELLQQETATCYFFLRIDNQIVQQETSGVQGVSVNEYYPLGNKDLGNGVKDIQYNTDNEGSINIAKWQALGLIENSKGITYATDDQPIPNDVFDKIPTFEQMALHVPDSKKIEIAGSVEAYNTDNYKIFWYVAKWQSSDRIIHVDGVLVPIDQVTVNVPEYKKRIIVEDLKGNITPGTQVGSSDFDFNDVVFDAITWQRNNKNHLKIILRAAGGQMPIYVAGKEVHEGLDYMFNTADPDYEFGKVLVQDSIIAEGASTYDFNNIPVEIVINGMTTTAGADIGQAPEKIAVGVDYRWCPERTSIVDVYPHFVQYVGDKTVTDWWK